MIGVANMFSRRPTIIAGALLGLAVMFQLRRYSGINHDSVLYLGQGLLHHWPAIFSDDPVFAYGRQDKYSVFPWLLDHAFNHALPPTVFLWGTLVALLAFIAASWACLRAMLPEGQRYWAWLAVLCLPTIYGTAGMFGYSEQFLTPRPIAEALCLLTIGLATLGRLRLACLCFAIAGVFHPLQAIAAALVIWPFAVMRDRRWLHAAWCIVPVVLLSIAGIKPFDDLWRQADPAWLQSLHQYTGQLFVSHWAAGDFSRLLFDGLALSYAWRVLRGNFGTWCAASLVGLASGVAASLLLVDTLHLILPAGLQLWRVHWLAHWFAMAAIGALLHRDVISRDLPRAMLLALCVVLVWNDNLWGWPAAAALYAAWSRISPRIPLRIQTLLGWLFAAWIAIQFVDFAATEFLSFRLAHYRLDLFAIDRRLLAFPIAGLALLLPCVHAWSRLRKSIQWTLTCAVLLPIAALTASRWDSRPVANRAFEQNVFRSDVFGIDIPEHAKVFWSWETDPNSLTGPWLVLRRVAYYGRGQLAGQVFSRATAVDASERLQRLLPLIRQTEACEDRSRPSEERLHCRIDEEAMRKACTPTTTAPPDYLVLPYDQPQRSIGRWDVIDPVAGEAAVTYRLYKCTDVLADLPQAGPRGG